MAMIPSGDPKLCFVAYVFGSYQDFIPTYIYSILRAFPQHHVKIFLEDPISVDNAVNLALLHKEVPGSFEIIDNFHDLDWCDVPHKPGHRFLLTKEYFEGFDYVYFGDVDFIVYNEYNDQFFNTYIAHCQSTGLPFSNEWNYDYGKYRMTGLHFIIKEPYFESMTDRIEETKSPLSVFRSGCYHNKEYPSYDEEMLFYMCMNEFDLRVLNGYRRPFHGLHLGTFRTFDPSWSFTIDHHGIDYLRDWRAATELREILEGDLFKAFYKTMSAPIQKIFDNTKFVLSTNMFL